MSATVQPKLTYKPQRKLEVFFTGGTARVTRDGQLLACCCGEQVKVGWWLENPMPNNEDEPPWLAD